MDVDFLKMMPDRVLIEPWLGNQTNGFPGAEYGASRAYPAYVQWTPKMVRDSSGATVVSSATSILDTTRRIVNGVPAAQSPADVIGLKDRITLPDQTTDHDREKNPAGLPGCPTPQDDQHHRDADSHDDAKDQERHRCEWQGRCS